MKHDVFIAATDARYAPFPYEGNDGVRAGLQALFAMWGRDPRNPFSEWLNPGDRVVVKPNWVHHENPRERDIEALVTHTSLIKHLLDLLVVALDGSGTVIIGDAPIQSCDFALLLERTRIREIVDDLRRRYPALDVTIEDWRLTVLDSGTAAQSQRAASSSEQGGAGFRLVDLGTSSFLEEISDYADKFRVTCYAPDAMGAHHRPGKHEYLVTNRVFGADLVINVPKMKTHIKAGLTGALKNLVGINGHKEFLPHHIMGSSQGGGDCYYQRHALRDLYDAAYDRFWGTYEQLSQPRRQLGVRLLAGLWRVSELVTGDSTNTGSWFANETVWRMTLDLNHLLYFGAHSPKRVISIVDGIVAGEGEGPLQPIRKPVGLLIGGENPAYVDCALARLMGYNVSRIPTVYHAVYHRRSQFADSLLEDVLVHVRQDDVVRRIPLLALPNLEFVKPRHWQRAASVPAAVHPSNSRPDVAEQTA